MTVLTSLVTAGAGAGITGTAGLAAAGLEAEAVWQAERTRHQARIEREHQVPQMRSAIRKAFQDQARADSEAFGSKLSAIYNNTIQKHLQQLNEEKQQLVKKLSTNKALLTKATDIRKSYSDLRSKICFDAGQI